MQTFRFFGLLFALLTTAVAPAQDLLKDGERLLGALDDLQNSAEYKDSVTWEALSILSLYDGPVQYPAPGAKFDPERLLQNVQANPLLRGLLPVAPLRLDHLPAEEASARMSGRKRIEQLMYGGALISPAQYLSVEQSLQDSRLPPLQNQEALRAAAGNAQSAKPVSDLRAEALMEGLFQFVLKRAQQEVAASFINNLLNNKKKPPQIGFLFPNVFGRYAKPQASYSQSFLEGLREAFFIDLKNLNRSLPELLLKDGYFSALQSEPVFYSVLATYSLFGQSNSGRPMWESAPLAHRSLFERRQAADKNLNIQLADSAFSGTAYIQVQAAARDYVGQLERVADTILKIQVICKSRISQLEEERMDVPAPLDKSLYNFRLLTGYPDPDSASFHLGLLPELLQGRLNGSTLARYPALDWYDLFSATPSREMRIAGLELARRVVDGSWYNGLSHVELLWRWQAALTDYKQRIDHWEMSIHTIGMALGRQFDDTNNRLDSLKTVINQTHQHWMESIDPVGKTAFIHLELIASNFDDIIMFDHSRQDSLRMLRERKEKLHNLEERLALLENRLAEKQKDIHSPSPFQTYLKRKKAFGLSEALAAEIGHLEALSDTLRVALYQLDTAHALKEYKALRSTQPMLQATELLSNLFYVLVDSDGQGLIHPDTFEAMLYEPRLKTACLGLMQQRLSRIRGVGQSSPDALAELAQLTLSDFAILDKATGNLLPGGRPDSLQLFHITSVGLRALNRILEFPLFIDPKKPQHLISLKEKEPALRHVPELSAHCMNFLYYLETGQHRPAIGAMARMLASLSEQLSPPMVKENNKGQRKKEEQAPDNNGGEPRSNRSVGSNAEMNRKPATLTAFHDESKGEELKPRQKPEDTAALTEEKKGRAQKPDSKPVDIPLVRFLATYGDFIAGLVDARNKEEVQYLMHSLAEDPGGSRTKRTHALSLSFNAYLGASAGRERWDRKQADTAVWAVAPYLPVGFTLSWLVFPNKERPLSFSLHLTGIDLGAMMAYRLEEEEEAFGTFKLSPKNIFKPGAQLQWNIPKVPCFVGVGWQTGAQFRDQGDREITLRSSRFFVAAGLDVPIRTLYARE